MSDAQAMKFGLFSPTEVFAGRWYALITSVFTHLELTHIFFNMYWLWFLGPPMERLIGPVRFAGFIVLTAIISSGWQLATSHDGIGFSGVGYAMIGFGWLARDKYPELKPYYNDRNLQMLAGWAVICVFIDYFNIMKIGNVAHVMGAAGGALVALSFIRKLWIARIGLIVVTIAAFVPVYWNPRSPDWNFSKAYDAHGRKDYDTAIRFYHRCDELGMSDMAVWHNIAIIEGYRKHKPEYKAAIARLRKIAPNDATVVVKDYGEPN